jgi:hypothetical protein
MATEEDNSQCEQTGESMDELCWREWGNESACENAVPEGGEIVEELRARLAVMEAERDEARRVAVFLASNSIPLQKEDPHDYKWIEQYETNYSLALTWAKEKS